MRLVEHCNIRNDYVYLVLQHVCQFVMSKPSLCWIFNMKERQMRFRVS